jgi:hypothetical protein
MSQYASPLLSYGSPFDLQEKHTNKRKGENIVLFLQPSIVSLPLTSTACRRSYIGDSQHQQQHKNNFSQI